MKSGSVSVETDAFPIVGVGASAGGLTALRRLLSALPERPGVALIVVQHHVPDHKTELPAIAAAWTRLPVRLVVDGELVQANHVYVAPSGCFVTLEDGVLRCRPMERPTGASPESVDRLFESLSRLGRRAAAVVLSGTGSDGTVGAVQI